MNRYRIPPHTAGSHRLRLFAFLAFLASVGVCPSALAQDGGPPTTDEVESSSATFTMEGASEVHPNPMQVQLSIGVDGGSLSTDPSDVFLDLNGLPADVTPVGLSESGFSVGLTLAPGRNVVHLGGADDEGMAVEARYVLWAGGETLPVRVLDEQNVPVPGASVEIRLADDQRVRASTETVGAVAGFYDLPPRTFIVVAEGPDGRYGTAGAVALGEEVLVRVSPIGEPSEIDNNDFSLGLDGWEVGAAPVRVEPHEEDYSGGGTTSSEECLLQRQRGSAHSASGSVAPALSRPSFSRGGAPTQGAAFSRGGDQDLVLDTEGEGPQSVSRTFVSGPGTSSITVRYRFVSREVPAGYFGSEFNDYYALSVRSENGGGLETDEGSMNGLGVGAFDEFGATAWREVTLGVDPEGDVVQVDVSVANVGDDLFDSTVIVDYVEEGALAIGALTLNDVNDLPLPFFSMGDHEYFDGYTRVHGTITVSGNPADELAALYLEVLQGEDVVATGDLAAPAAAVLLQPFGDDGAVGVTSSRLLFEVPAGGPDPTTDGSVTLRVRAVTAQGQEVIREAGSFEHLVRFAGVNRYGQRDGAQGGDDWARPSVRRFIGESEPFGFVIGDVSNMHGGPFPPHDTHREGENVDAWFDGYNDRDAETAGILVGYLDSDLGPRVGRVYVTYGASAGDPFFDAIDGVFLSDGRRATDVIRPLGGHATHFHLNVLPSDGDERASPVSFHRLGGRSLPARPPYGSRASAARAEGSDCSAPAAELALAVYPSPSRIGTTSVTVDVEVARSGRYTVALYDVLGRRMQRLFEGPLPAGAHSVRWDLSRTPSASLPAGLYFVRATSDGGVTVTRAVTLVR